MKRGATIDVLVQFTEFDQKTPLPITGATVTFMIKRRIDDADNVALTNLTQPRVTINGPLGQATCTLTATEANNLPNNVPLFCEAMAVFPDARVVRTHTQGFTLEANLIKAIA